MVSTVLITNAQPIKPFITVVKTASGNVRGVLYKVDSAHVFIDSKNGFITINSNEIQSIKIREVKKKYQVKKVFKYDKWDESNFEENGYSVPVRKWGEKDPTLKEEITGKVGTSLMNALVNVIAWPIHAINPGIARVKFNDEKKYADQAEMLSDYSVYYQANPNMLKELQQLKAIGKTIKR
ncbi:MAG: hypothetical protein H7Y07_09345 [Pyrinomonadaceae bacterium]|nr:hypothetical protein [Sphingobacteriaceae bacterium]